MKGSSDTLKNSDLFKDFVATVIWYIPRFDLDKDLSSVDFTDLVVAAIGVFHSQLNCWLLAVAPESSLEPSGLNNVITILGSPVGGIIPDNFTISPSPYTSRSRSTTISPSVNRGWATWIFADFFRSKYLAFIVYWPSENTPGLTSTLVEKNPDLSGTAVNSYGTVIPSVVLLVPSGTPIIVTGFPSLFRKEINTVGVSKLERSARFRITPDIFIVSPKS